MWKTWKKQKRNPTCHYESKFNLVKVIVPHDTLWTSSLTSLLFPKPIHLALLSLPEAVSWLNLCILFWLLLFNLSTFRYEKNKCCKFPFRIGYLILISQFHSSTSREQLIILTLIMFSLNNHVCPLALSYLLCCLFTHFLHILLCTKWQFQDNFPNINRSKDAPFFEEWEYTNVGREQQEEAVLFLSAHLP